MPSPIQKGDLAEVISGVLGDKSPNLGLIVEVLAQQGDHSKYGRMWLCQAEHAELAQPGVNVPPGDADFAQDWLRKIEPPAKTDTATTNRTKEVTQ